MARRLRNLLVNTEYKDTDNKRKLRNIITNIEYINSENQRKLHNLVVMIEYSGTPAVSQVTFGPSAWIMS